MTYTDEEKTEIIDSICERVENGESLRSILRSSKEEGSKLNYPTAATFFKWLEADQSRIKQYARACEVRAETIFDEMLEIADDGTNDTMTVTSKGGVEYDIEDKEWTNRSKLRIDTRKWILGKMNPKKYSDKLQVDNTPFVEQPLFPDLKDED